MPFSVNTDLINPSLNNEATATSRNKLLEHFFKVLSYLLECSLNSLILALIKGFDQFLDRFGRFVEVFSPLNQLVALFSKVVVLLKSFLVDVGELFEAFIDSVQLLHQLKRSCIRRNMQKKVAVNIPDRAYRWCTFRMLLLGGHQGHGCSGYIHPFGS